MQTAAVVTLMPIFAQIASTEEEEEGQAWQGKQILFQTNLLLPLYDKSHNPMAMMDSSQRRARATI
jgi:hypothetical protein